MTTNTETAIWERVIEPAKTDLPPDAARYILGLDFRPEDIARMNALAAKGRDGTLSQDEQAELESYRHVGHVLAFIQSKARRSLQRSGFAA